MREEIASLARELLSALEAEADLPSGEHFLAPRAEPRRTAPARTIERIAAEVRACARCSLCRTRKHAVPGEGPEDARLVVIGEAPGAEEDRRGLPFVGKAGDLLTKMLAAINIAREEVFIGNVLKCRPPQNRDPGADEIAECRRYLMAQIAAIRPPLILTLGRFSAQLLLGTSRGILSIRGNPRPFPYEGGVATILPSLHPAYLLRNAAAKREAWEDMKLLHRLLREKTGDWPAPMG